MKKVLPGLILCLLLFAQPATLRAQTKARAEKFDADPLAAALHVVRKMEPDAMGREDQIIRLALAYAEAGRHEESLSISAMLEDNWQKAMLLARVANGLAAAGKFDRATETASDVMSIAEADEWLDELMQSVVKDIVGEEERYTFEVLFTLDKKSGVVARLVEADRKDDAARLLARAHRLALDEDFNDDKAALVLVHVARRHAEMGEKREASEALADALIAARRMADDDERATTLCEIVDEHARTGGRAEAEKILKEAFEAASTPAARGERSLTLVASRYAEMGLFEQALEAARALEDEEGRARAFAIVAGARASAGQREGVDALLSQAIEIAAVLEYDNMKSSTLSGIARHAGKGAPEVLLKVVRAAEALDLSNERANVLIVVGDKYAELGRTEEALEVWGRAFEAASSLTLEKEVLTRSDVRIRNDREKVSLLQMLAKRFVKAGQEERVREVARALEDNFRQALEVAKGSIADVGQADLALAALAGELISAKRHGLALEVLASASRVAEKDGENVSPFSRAGALAVIGSAYARTSDRGKAAHYFQLALDVTSGTEDYSGSNRTGMLADIGKRYTEAGLKPDARARKTLRRIVRDIEKELEE